MAKGQRVSQVSLSDTDLRSSITGEYGQHKYKGSNNGLQNIQEQASSVKIDSQTINSIHNAVPLQGQVSRA